MPLSSPSSISGGSNSARRRRTEHTDTRPWFIASVAVTAILAAVLIWHIVYSYMLLNSFKDRELAIERSSRKLLLYAETMKSAALISATTGDLRWQKKYRNTRPELEAALQKIPSLIRSDRVKETTARIKKNLETIRQIENQAFELVSHGDKKEAFRLLSGWAYTKNQLGFSKKTRELMEIIRNRIRERTSFTKTRIALFGVAAGLLFLVFSWAVTIRNWKIHVKTKQAAEEKVALLLDNSGQGFLLFDDTLCVDPNYSLECRHMFGTDPSGRFLPDLLFPEGGPDADHFAGTVSNLLHEPDDFKRDTIISLLPERFHLNGRDLEIEYRPIPGKRMMLVLTDITEKTRLEKQMEDEHVRLSFIVTALENKSDLLDTISRFENFLGLGGDTPHESNGPAGLSPGDIFRRIHTFKGLFSQFEMHHTAECLHKTESLLTERMQDRKASGKEDLSRSLPVPDLLEALEADSRILKEAIGDEFFSEKGKLAVPMDRFLDIVHEVETMLKTERMNDRQRRRLESLLEKLKRMRYVNIKKLLARHAEYLDKIAGQTGKSIHPVKIEGADARVDPEKAGPFTGSLVHVFTNALVHGIETPEEREREGKDEQGNISCRTDSREGRLVIRIKDDGRGIDKTALANSVVNAGIRTRSQVANLTDRELLHLVFSDTVTTAHESDRLSGRGIGLEAVLSETRKLNGTVEVFSRNGRGTEFIFTLPCGSCRTGHNPVDSGTRPGVEDAHRFDKEAYQ